MGHSTKNPFPFLCGRRFHLGRKRKEKIGNFRKCRRIISKRKKYFLFLRGETNFFAQQCKNLDYRWFSSIPLDRLSMKEKIPIVENNAKYTPGERAEHDSTPSFANTCAPTKHGSMAIIRKIKRQLKAKLTHCLAQFFFLC